MSVECLDFSKMPPGYYERRLALAQRLVSNGFDVWHHWPHCLDWSDADCDAVERWLIDGGEVPEVLREA